MNIDVQRFNKIAMAYFKTKIAVTAKATITATVSFIWMSPRRGTGILATPPPEVAKVPKAAARRAMAERKEES